MALPQSFNEIYEGIVVLCGTILTWLTSKHLLNVRNINKRLSAVESNCAVHTYSANIIDETMKEMKDDNKIVHKRIDSIFRLLIQIQRENSNIHIEDNDDLFNHS